MFETFCVADEFVFSRFRDVFEHSDRPMVEVKIGLEECSWVGLVNCLCHIGSLHDSSQSETLVDLYHMHALLHIGCFLNRHFLQKSIPHYLGI